MFTRPRFRPRRRPFSILAIASMLFLMLAAPAGAQAAPATVNVNSYQCPAGYDQVSDCIKTGGVVVSVSADGQVVGEVTTFPEGPAEVEVPVGAEVTVTVIGGVPEGTTQEPANLTFSAVEGTNPVTLVFVEPPPVEPVDTDQDGLPDDREAQLGTDPNAYDTDGDGVPDGGEVNAGTDPLNVDTDGDGFTDREELDVQSDPLDPASVPVTPVENSVAVTMYTCPAGYEGKDLFTDCTTPAVGVDVTLSLDFSEFGVAQATDASGSVLFANLGSGSFSVHEDLNDLGFSLLRFSVNCFGEPIAPDAPEPRQVAFSYMDESGFGLQLTQGEQITCTWFNIPVAATQTPVTPTPVATKPPVVTLPNTGDGVVVEEDDNGEIFLVAGAAVCVLAAGLSLIRRRKA